MKELKDILDNNYESINIRLVESLYVVDLYFTEPTTGDKIKLGDCTVRFDGLITTVYVNSKYRNNGYAKKLIEIAIHFLHADSVTCDVKFYDLFAKFGFVEASNISYINKFTLVNLKKE